MTKLQKRLLPLYLAAFFQGFVLYYVADKLLADSVGLTATNIAVVVAVMSGVTVLAEIPSGILADRWSRRGTLIVAQVFLGLSVLFGAFADSGVWYVMNALAWGLFYAMYSGVYQAVTYDTLYEEQGHAKNYDKIFGRVGQAEGLAMLAGSIIGGVVLARWGIHATYFATIPSVVLGVVALLFLHEPQFHKQEQADTNLIKHTKDTFKATASSGV
ncbi:MAG: MFS transporter, partial [Cumulibacter sp.]